MPFSVMMLSTWSVIHLRAAGLPRFNSAPPSSQSGWFLANSEPPDDPLRLEPDDQLRSLRVSVIADGLDALGESLRIDLPRARLRPGVAGIPAGVHPPIVELDAFLGQDVDELLFAGLADLQSLEESAAAEAVHRAKRFAAGPGML